MQSVHSTSSRDAEPISACTCGCQLLSSSSLPAPGLRGQCSGQLQASGYFVSDPCILKAAGSLATVGPGRRHVLASHQLILLISSASHASHPSVAVANQALLLVLSVTCSCPVQQKYSLKVIYSVRNAITFCPVRKTPTRLPTAIMTPASSVLCQSQPADVLSRLHKFLHPGCKTANLPHQKCPLKPCGILRVLRAMVSPPPPLGHSCCSFALLSPLYIVLGQQHCNACLTLNTQLPMYCCMIGLPGCPCTSAAGVQATVDFHLCYSCSCDTNVMCKA